MTNNLRTLRLALVAAGITVAAPSFAATVTPLCGDDKGSDHGDKNKSENKKEKEPKKPTNPA